MSFGNRVIVVLALIGGLLALWVIYFSYKTQPPVPILFEPARSPYKHFIAGEGIIESIDQNIDLGPIRPELVIKVYCTAGQSVKKGDPLFELDTRSLEADLKKTLEDLARAKTDYENKSYNYSYYERVHDKGAVSEQEVNAAHYEKELAHNQIQIATAVVNQVEIEIERSMARAPCDGEVLQVNVHEGEFANVNPYDGLPLVIFGDTREYHLRINIDETEAWRYKKGQPATAFLRGNPKIKIPLEFAYIEPLVIPKKSLTGLNTERVDTRVLQVVYRFCKDVYPVYVGQLLDVFVKAEPYEVSS